jgi:Winged helix-turn helix
MARVIQMSDRELTRLRVMIDLADDRLTVEAAATLMGLGRRQIYRLRRAFSADGPAGLASRKRGQPSNRKHGETFRATVLSILKAIEAGAWSTTLQDRLAELEARKKILRDELAASGVATEEMVIDLDGAKMYRKYVADLEATLNDDEVRTEAADLLRGLIDRVVLIPDPTAPDGLRGELNGAVAEILLLSDRVPGVLPLQAGRKKPPGTLVSGGQLSVVAGSCKRGCYNFRSGRPPAAGGEVENSHHFAA